MQWKISVDMATGLVESLGNKNINLLMGHPRIVLALFQWNSFSVFEGRVVKSLIL